MLVYTNSKCTVDWELQCFYSTGLDEIKAAEISETGLSIHNLSYQMSYD